MEQLDLSPVWPRGFLMPRIKAERCRTVALALGAGLSAGGEMSRRQLALGYLSAML